VGQDEVRALVDDGVLTFVRNETADRIRKRLQAGQFDLIVSRDPKTLERIFPEVLTLYIDPIEGYSVYTADPGIRDELFLPTPTPVPTEASK